MPEPVYGDVHVAAALTDVAVAYLQDESYYIADKIFPMIPVQHQTDVYYVWSKADFFRDEAQLRADATESAGSGVNLTTQTYSAKVWALHQDIGDQVRQNADPAVEIDVVATQQLMQKMLIRRDRFFVTTYLQPSIWGTTITGVASAPSASQTIQWSDDANGDPFSDIATGQTTVLQNTGFLPNVLLITWPVYQALRKHPLIIDRIKYTNPAFAGTITPQLLAEALDIEEVIVSKAVYNSAAQGATVAMGLVAGKVALLAYRAPQPGLMVPTAGYTFGWTGLIDLNNLGIAIYQIPMPWRGIKTVRTEAEMAFDMQVVGSDLGYFFNTIVA
jgi:hypothetical protein